MSNVVDRHPEMLEKASRKQFSIKNIHQKKLVESHQRVEETKINKHREGKCYWCESYTFVAPTLVVCCYPCAEKRDLKTILAIAARKMHGVCEICGKYPKLRYKYNLAQINVRLCMKCMTKVCLNHRDFNRQGGEQSANPYYKWLRRKFGKDYPILVTDGSIRR